MKLGRIIAISGIIVTIISIVVTIILSGFFSTSGIDYQVQVVDKSNAIANINVQLQIDDSDGIITQVTDSMGIARFANVLTKDKTKVTISILATDNYKGYKINQLVDKSTPFFEIQLRPKY